jgi:hypothetical protein
MSNVKTLDGFRLAAHRDEGIIVIGEDGDYWILVGTDYLEATDNKLTRAWRRAVES